MKNIASYLWQYVHDFLSQYIVPDKWFYMSTGTSIGGLSLNEIFLQPFFIFSVTGQPLSDKIINNPVPYMTALTILGTFAFSAWQKIKAERRADQKHEEEMKEIKENNREN